MPERAVEFANPVEDMAGEIVDFCNLVGGVYPRFGADMSHELREGFQLDSIRRTPSNEGKAINLMRAIIYGSKLRSSLSYLGTMAEMIRDNDTDSPFRGWAPNEKRFLLDLAIGFELGAFKPTIVDDALAIEESSRLFLGDRRMRTEDRFALLSTNPQQLRTQTELIYGLTKLKAELGAKGKPRGRNL